MAIFMSVFGLCFSGCHPIHLCLLCHLGLLPPSLALIPLCLLGYLSLSLCTSLYWHSILFSCPHGSLWVISAFVFGPRLPSRSYLFSSHPCLPVISAAGFHPSIHLCAGSCHSISLPIYLGPSSARPSSSVPSSPLSPSPSAVSPTGSACCSRCSCTAVWGLWPGAT